MSNEIKKITTGKSLGQLLDGLISETVKTVLHQRSLKEKDKQDSLGGDDQEKKEKGEDKSGFDVDVNPSATVAADSEDVKAMKGVPDYDVIVDKLNTIRAGKSLTNKDVSGAFKEYIESLSDPERVALFTFLKGIAQVISGEVPGSQAIDPGDEPADIQMKTGPDVQKRHIEPNVIKKPMPAPGKKKTSDEKEDTSPPIVAKGRK